MYLKKTYKIVALVNLIFLISACTNTKERELMRKIVFANAIDESKCVLVEEVTCKTTRILVSDTCEPWFQKRAVRQGGTHVVRGETEWIIGEYYVGTTGVSAGRAPTGKLVPGMIFNCKLGQPNPVVGEGNEA